jgi:hypothetical protein
MAFVVTPRARYHHQIGSKFALKLLELAVRWLTKDSCQCDMGADTISDMVMECYLIGACKLEKGRCLGCPKNNCY